ncbi:hypothetical protein LCGC14_1200750 [marine sediment metagenome]|uniref:Uncharacterized protein n=1 Tax=marine sediment metagenome TaxID=412755 RepID=A0A0F9M4B9_9ZZZZ
MKFKCEGCALDCIVELDTSRPQDIKYCVIDGNEEEWEEDLECF